MLLHGMKAGASGSGRTACVIRGGSLLADEPAWGCENGYMFSTQSGSKTDSTRLPQPGGE